MEQLVNPYKKYYAHFPKGVHINCSNCPNAFEEGINTGRREVVEWMKKYRSESTREFVCLTFVKEMWQAKFKEWGFDD